MRVLGVFFCGVLFFVLFKGCSGDDRWFHTAKVLLTNSNYLKELGFLFLMMLWLGYALLRNVLD